MFADRRDAGRQLAATLLPFRSEGRSDRVTDAPHDIVVVGLARGGVPVAREVAALLRAPLDVMLVRKLGLPRRPELAMGAIAEGGIRWVDDDLIRRAAVTRRQLAQVEERERHELDVRARFFRSGRPPISLESRVVIVVDDGIATGSTARVACERARVAGADRVVLAVPVAPRGWDQRLAGAADEYVAVDTPADFQAVGRFYADFSQTTDVEVVEHLRSIDAALRRMR